MSDERALRATRPHSRRVLVAGVGNVLRGDDGFGPAVIRALAACRLPEGVRLVDVGIGGIALVHELMDGYDEVIVVDAVDGAGAPGSLSVLAPDVPAASTLHGGDGAPFAADMHEALPAQVLSMADALGVLPPVVRIVGCQPAETEELTTSLSPEVARAVDAAVATIRDLVAADTPDPVADLRRRDEILQVLFWLDAEGLGPDITAADVARFLGDDAAVRAGLRQLVRDGLAEARPGAGADARYRLTSRGRIEGRRRFLDEFEPYLARGGHGECGTADCDCHRGGECRTPT